MEEKKTIQEEVNQALGTKGEEQEIKKSKGKFPVLRTLKQDADDYIKRKNVSMVDIAAEHARAGRSGLTEEKSTRFSWAVFPVVSIVIVVIVAAGGFFGWKYFKNVGQTDGEEILLIKPILVAEEEFRVEVSEKGKFLSSIEEAMNFSVQLGRLLSIPVISSEEENKREVGIKEFLSLLDIVPPLSVTDSLNNKFMLVKFYSTADRPVLILKIASYNHAFAGMLTWERSLFDDFKELFSFDEYIAGDFKDKEVQGRDARVLEKENGGIALIYAFFGREYLVITTDEEPFVEIFRRFTSPQYLND